MHGPYLKHNPRLLQQVGPHVRPDDTVLLVEQDFNVLPKATAVVVPDGLGVSEGLGHEAFR